MNSVKLPSCIFLFLCVWQTLSCSENISYETATMIRHDILNGKINVIDGIDRIIKQNREIISFKDEKKDEDMSYLSLLISQIKPSYGYSEEQKEKAKKIIKGLEKEQQYFIQDFENMSKNIGTADEKNRMERAYTESMIRLYDEISHYKRITGEKVSTRESVLQAAIGAGLILLGYTLFAPRSVLQVQEDALSKDRLPATPKTIQDRLREKLKGTTPSKTSASSKPEQKKFSTQVPQKKWEAKTFLSSMLGLLYSESLLLLAGDLLSYSAPAVLYTKNYIPVIHPSIGLIGAAAYVQAAIIEKYAETMKESDVQRLIKRTDPLFFR